MGQKIVTLSGAATDVLYALFFRGALQSGDLPSKSGAAELREFGFAETRHAATEYQKENYFTFLTAEGQTFAVEHLVNTRFGESVAKQEYFCPLAIGIQDAQKVLDDIDKQIRNSDAFKDLVPSQSHEVVINNHYHVTIATDDNGKQYAAGMGIAVEDGKKTVQFLADRFAVHDGKVFINEAFLKAGSVNSAPLADKDGKETGRTRTRTTRISYASNRQRVEDIVGDYLTGEASEFIGEMVDELIALIAEPESDTAREQQVKTSQQDAAIVTLSNAIANMGETIRKTIREEMRPGGLLCDARGNSKKI